MNLIFIHGWSVTTTETYGELPQILAKQAADYGISLNLVNIHLGRYISFHNEVRMDDVARALQQALLDALPDGNNGIKPFSCITHSTGGPVARTWLNRYFAKDLSACPLRHLIMLAPANHGSALAAIGSARMGRIKAATSGIEPGDGILRWLELGSEEARKLNQSWIEIDPLQVGSKFRPFVLTGETIDQKFYDFVNSYLAEKGSDGVVRVSAASIDYRWLHCKETEASIELYKDEEGKPVVANLLKIEGDITGSKTCPLMVVPKASHTGDRMGIMKSPTLSNASNKPVVAAILEALSTKTKTAYQKLQKEWAQKTIENQGSGKGKRFFQLIIHVKDDEGFRVNDYDFILLAGEEYHPNKLPKGFFIDKQQNKHTPHIITFYLDFDVMMKIKSGKFGFRIVARPDSGFGYYKPVEFRSDTHTIDAFIDPNATHYIDVTLKRHVDEQTARFDPATGGEKSFKDTKPSGVEI